MSPNAAVYWDLENVHGYLEQRFRNQDAVTVMSELMTNLRSQQEASRSEPWIIQSAYADFDRMPDQIQSTLYLMGIEPIHVVGTVHKNAADMRLVTDVMETLYTREAISTFYIISGDRDYIPVINHLRKNGATVIVGAFPGILSGDLKMVVGPDHLLDLTEYIPESFTEQARHEPTGSGIERPSPEEDVAAAVKLLLHHDDLGREAIWLTPFKREIDAALPHLSFAEAGQLISRLVTDNVVRIEKESGTGRSGDPIEFSVLRINFEHPLVAGTDS